jgi:hypothetical protein
LIIVVFFIYIDTPLFSINPLLKIFFGYNIYEVNYDGKKFFLLTKKKYAPGEINIKIKQLDLEVLIEDD